MQKTTLFYFMFFLVCAVFSYLYASAAIAQSRSEEAVKFNNVKTPFGELFHETELYDPALAIPDMVLIDQNGEESNLNVGTGKWRLINFWASWCAPCINEIPTLLKLSYARSGTNFEVVFISLDFPSGNDEFLESSKKLGLNSHISSFFTPDYEVWPKLRLAAIPTSLVISPEGQLKYKLVGDIDWMSKESLAFWDDLLDY